MTEIVLGIRLTADGKDLVGAVRVSTDQIKSMTDAVKQSASESDKLNAQQKNLGQTLNVTSNSIGAYSAAWNKAADLIVRTAGAVKDYIKDAALLNARHETLGVVLSVVGRNAGYSRGEMELYAESVRKSGITMIESRESIVKMVQANLDLAIAHKLARAAQDAAVIANINSSEAFARMIHGIQSGQTEILRTMGINVNFEDSYKKLAKQLNVTTAQLTEQEKTQARANVTLEATAQIVGVYEAAMGTAGKQLNSLTRYHQDLKTLSGETFNDVLVIAVNAYTDALKDANAETRRLSEQNKLREWAEDAILVVAKLADLLKTVALAVPGAAWIPQIRDLVTKSHYDAAKNFFTQRAAEAAQKALEGRYDEMDFGSRYAPKTGAARPTGKTEGADMRAFVRQLREQVEITKQSTLEEKVLFELREKHWKNATPQIKTQAVELARQLDLRKQEEQVLAANLKHYEYLAGERERQNDAVYQFNKSNTDTLQQLELETQLIGKTREQQELLTGLSRLESEYRKTSVDLTGRAAESAKKLYDQQRLDLEDKIRSKNTAQRAQDVIDKNKEAAKRLEDDLQRGLTDSIFRGFEAGKGFAENFRDSLVNMFKTTILRPVIQWVVSPLTGAATAALGALGIPGLANAAGGAGGLSSLGSLGNLFGGSQTLADFGNFFGSIGSITEAGSTFGVLDAIGGFAAANPWTAAAMVALPLLGGLFGGGGGPASWTGGRFTGTAGVGGIEGAIYGSSKNSEEAFSWEIPGRVATYKAELDTIVADVFSRMTTAGKLLGADLERLSGFRAGFDIAGLGAVDTENTVQAFVGNLGQITDQIALQLLPNLRDFQQANESLTQTFARLAEEAEAIAQQRHQLEIRLMEAQGNATGALAARRADELQAMDASLRGLLQQIHAAEDLTSAAKAAETAAQAAKQAGEERLSMMRSAEDQLRQAYREQSAALEQTAAKWKQAAQSLRQYRDALLLGDLSPLSPEARYAEAARQFGDVSSRARLGDESAINQLQAVSEAFLQASRGYNASGGDYVRDFERVRDTLAATASVADRQSSIAQEQLDVLQEQLRGIVDLNTTALSIAQLLAGLGNAVAGMVRPYGQDLVNPAGARAEQWNALTSGGAAWASRAGAVAIRQPGDIEALIRATDGSSFTTADARSFINERMAANDPLAVYNAAREKGISLASVDAIAGWGAGVAETWAREQGLPSFDAGGRAQPGLALVGESGPELVRFGAPAQVFSASQTRATLGLGNDDGTGRETVAELRALIRLQSAANQALLDKLERVEKRLGGIEANARIEAAA